MRHNKKTTIFKEKSTNDASCGHSFLTSLHQQIKSLCTSDEEALSIAEAIEESFECNNIDSSNMVVFMNHATESILEYFEDKVSPTDAKDFIYAAMENTWGQEYLNDNGLKNDRGKENIGIKKHEINKFEDNDGDDGDAGEGSDDGDYIGEGECELCERTIKLTRHHLIPRMTWPRLRKKMLNNAKAIMRSVEIINKKINENNRKSEELLEDDDKIIIEENKAKIQKMLGGADLIDIPTTINRDSVRNYLSQVCLICRQCHSSVHHVHSEWDLATRFNTVDRLLECEDIVRFSKWANKQRVGKRVVR